MITNRSITDHQNSVCPTLWLSSTAFPVSPLFLLLDCGPSSSSKRMLLLLPDPNLSDCGVRMDDMVMFCCCWFCFFSLDCCCFGCCFCFWPLWPIFRGKLDSDFIIGRRRLLDSEKRRLLAGRWEASANTKLLKRANQQKV